MRKRKEQPASLSTEEIQELSERAAKDERRKELGKLIRTARTTAGMNMTDLAKAVDFHVNQVRNWEIGIGDAEKHLALIEHAVKKPPGWFELQLDPIGHVIQMAEEVAEIKRLVEKIALKVL